MPLLLFLFLLLSVAIATAAAASSVVVDAIVAATVVCVAAAAATGLLPCLQVWSLDESHCHQTLPLQFPSLKVLGKEIEFGRPALYAHPDTG